MRRRFRLVGVLVAVIASAGGALVVDAFDDIDQAARANTPAHRLAAPPAEMARQTPATATSPAGSSLSAADEVIAILNQTRSDRGLAPYEPHPQVMAAAQAHSNDMAARNRMSHTGSDGSNGGSRLTAHGFTWSAWGENIGAGQRDAQSIVSAWMQSSGHLPQMVGNYQYVGVGVASSSNGTLYWTLVVASGS